jgi:YVTN family beta-propeller protein
MPGNRFSYGLVELMLLSGLLAGLPSAIQAQTVVTNIALPDGAQVVAVNSATNRIYVGRGVGVAVVDGATDAVVATIPGYAYQIAVDPVASRLYVSGQSSFGAPGNLNVFDTSTNNLVASIPNLPGGPAALAVNPATNRVYVGCGACSQVSVLDGASHQIIATVPGYGRLTVNPTTNRLYTLNVGNGVDVVDGATNSVLGAIPVGKALPGVAVNPTTNTVYVLDADNNSLAVIDGTSNTVSATVSLGVVPTAVAVDPTTGHVFVAGRPPSALASASGTLTVIDGGTRAVLDTVGVGAMPSDVAVNPTTHRVYVTNQTSNTVTAVQDAASGSPHDARYFGQTGFRVDNDAVWDYFIHRGGIVNFGYPVSRLVRFHGYQVQFFQRRIVELDQGGHPRLLNLLDTGLMPYSSFNGAEMPGFDGTFVATAPPANDAAATLAFVQANAPNTFQGMPVNFDQTFYNTITASTAFPNGGDPNLLPRLRSGDVGCSHQPTCLRSKQPQLRLLALSAWDHDVRRHLRLHARGSACRLPQGHFDRTELARGPRDRGAGQPALPPVRLQPAELGP